MEKKEEIFKMELRNLESLLQKKFGNQLQVVEYVTEPLLSFGENYGSTLLKVHAKIKKKSDADEEELNLAAKMLPPTNFQRQLFLSSCTFRKEVFLYEELIPSYQKLEKEFGVTKIFDILPEFYGARFTLSSKDAVVDEDAVILMQNLKVLGYYMGDRFQGLDLEHSKIAIKSLARFHGLGMAMKTHKPDYFQMIKDQAKFMISDEDDDFTNFLEFVHEDPEMCKYYERIEFCVNQDSDRIWFDPPPEPWSTIVHSDFWINNFLFRKENGNVVDIKFVDFQNYLLMSPLRELIFFLFLNLRFDVMKNNFEELIDHYYNIFVMVLKKMRCDVDVFARDKFDERLKIDAFEEFPHIPLMMRITNLNKENVQGFDSIEDVIFGSSINSLYTKKIRVCVKKYIEKGWL